MPRPSEVFELTEADVIPREGKAPAEPQLEKDAVVPFVHQNVIGLRHTVRLAS